MLGYGSQGTMVYEGSLHGRNVAVKRMLRHLYHLAKKEIDALILSDEVSAPPPTAPPPPPPAPPPPPPSDSLILCMHAGTALQAMFLG